MRFILVISACLISILLIVPPSVSASGGSINIYYSESDITIGSFASSQWRTLIASDDNNLAQVNEGSPSSQRITYAFNPEADSTESGTWQGECGAGSRWQCVDDSPYGHDGNTTKIVATTSGALIRFDTTDSAAGQLIEDARIVIVARANTSATGITAQARFSNNATICFSQSITVSPGGGPFNFLSTTNQTVCSGVPISAYTPAMFNNIQIVLQCTCTGGLRATITSARFELRVWTDNYRFDIDLYGSPNPPLGIFVSSLVPSTILWRCAFSNVAGFHLYVGPQATEREISAPCDDSLVETAITQSDVLPNGTYRVHLLSDTENTQNVIQIDFLVATATWEGTSFIDVFSIAVFLVIVVLVAFVIFFLSRRKGGAT